MLHSAAAQNLVVNGDFENNLFATQCSFNLTNSAFTAAVPAVTAYGPLDFGLTTVAGTQGTVFWTSPLLNSNMFMQYTQSSTATIAATELSVEVSNTAIDSWLWLDLLEVDGSIGTIYCSPAVPNSTGAAGLIGAGGSPIAANNNILLAASNLPQNQFGYFLNSMTQGFVPFPGGSQGNLCLAGAIGRYNSSVFNTGAAGTGSVQLNLTQTPTPTGPVAVSAGQTWNFQCWYRDLNPSATSNFTDAVSMTFL